MPYLTSPSAQKTERTFRYFCELASDELELDRDGIPVPVDYKTVDVVVTEPTKTALQTLIAATSWLKGYTMVSHWIPDDCAEF